MPGENGELRTLLMETIDGVKSGELDVDKALAIAELTKAVICVERAELDTLAFIASHPEAAQLKVRQPLAITHDDDDRPQKTHPAIKDASPPKPKPQPASSPMVTQVRVLLKSDQPLELDEIAKQTGINKAELFKILADESQFERDTDGFYWIAEV